MCGCGVCVCVCDECTCCTQVTPLCLSLLSQYEEGSGSERGGLRLPKSRYKGDTHLNSRQCLDMLALNELLLRCGHNIVAMVTNVLYYI